jgi:AcrR family transcriptional regulator
MSATRDSTAPSRRALRRAETRAEILAAAWDLARAHGLAGLSMRDLATRVGMRAPSLYGYFASKDEIYDAMFRQGYEEFRAWMSQPADDVAALRRLAHRHFEFCVSDPVRYQLLFQRTIPGFTPSPGSYAIAVAALEEMTDGFARVGITDPDAVDLATAVLTGLTSQQLTNDPGGDRWGRLLDRAVSMLLATVAPHLLPQPTADHAPSRTDRRATP